MRTGGGAPDRYIHSTALELARCDPWVHAERQLGQSANMQQTDSHKQATTSRSSSGLLSLTGQKHHKLWHAEQAAPFPRRNSNNNKCSRKTPNPHWSRYKYMCHWPIRVINPRQYMATPPPLAAPQCSSNCSCEMCALCANHEQVSANMQGRALAIPQSNMANAAAATCTAQAHSNKQHSSTHGVYTHPCMPFTRALRHNTHNSSNSRTR